MHATPKSQYQARHARNGGGVGKSGAADNQKASGKARSDQAADATRPDSMPDAADAPQADGQRSWIRDEADAVSKGFAPNSGQAAEQSADAEEEPGSPQDSSEEEDELLAARAEADELRDRYLRLQAEWDNFRKRTSAEREAEQQRAAERLMERLLPVLDDLQRAVEHSDASSEASLAEGVSAVRTKLNDVLAKEGLKEVDPLGEPFDANLHSAVGVFEDATCPEETVCQVYQKGYELAGRLLRPAMVVVTSGGPPRASSQEQ
ncbi:MAG: nucleotide exchange factor GrpE [Coriobacteriales bacterium]|jgi:molecular chaperone GrpE|nr:nucleotide exchange factor GrpE [Coriobacteriales bacterium]